MPTNETCDLDAEILLAANPYRIPTADDLVEAARGCNQYKHVEGCPHAINNAADEVYKLMDEVKKYRNFGNKTELDYAIDQWDSALSKSKSALERAKTDEEKEEAKKEYLKTIKYGKMIFEDYKKYYSKKN